MFFKFSKKYFVFFSVLINVNLIKAQLGKEAWHWQFGQNAAIDFSSGIPITGTCAINTTEGSASISDANTGQLLFYSDGTKVWDKNNNQMPNGFGMIGGQGTSTQAALIVPKPGSSTIYYLISADQGGYYNYPNNIANQGVHYSVVDMSLNGGLGDVTTKNVLLTPPPTTEKLTAVRHCNGTDYWIITHSFNSNTFNIYLLTASGISTTPIASNIGTVQNNVSGTYNETIGYLKASPNGKKLAMAVSKDMNFVELFDFDNLTGIVSNPTKISYETYNYGVYGIAFSPDNSKLYTTIESPATLFQYDLTLNNPTAIIASQTSVFSSSFGGTYIEAIQLASDNKIYVAFYDSIKLAVINNPNGLGLSSNFTLNGPVLPFGALSLVGLPNFIEANNSFGSHTYDISLCSFTSYTLTANGNSHFQWLNGDTTQSTNINSFGNYLVSYINPKGCKEIDTFNIIQIQPSTIKLLHDTSQCNNLITPVNIDATYPNVSSYFWNDGYTSPVRTINNPGDYWVDYTLTNFCVSRDSFSYSINNIPIVNLGNDTTFCLGDLQLNAFNPSSVYLWNTNQMTPTITATKAQTYWVSVTNQYGCVNADTLIVHPEFEAFNFILPNIVTPNNDNMNDFIDFGAYQFSSLQIEIYNRWGKKIFESSDPFCVWKPTQEDGIYFLVINYRIDCGSESQSRSFKNYITILR